MIRSFRNKGLKRFAGTGDASRPGVEKAARIARILTALHVAKRPEALNVPGFRFHALTGNMKGRFAVKASEHYRITFGWNGNDAVDVDLEDYH